MKNLAVVVRVLQTTQKLVISRCCFAEDGKEMYQELNCSDSLLICFILAIDIPVDVALVLP